MPAKLRTAAALPLAAASLFALSSCFLTPTPTPTRTPDATASPTSTGEGRELIDTTWAGTDSEGDDWSYTFQQDGTVAVVLNDELYDDESDVWTVSETEIVISVNGGDQFGDIIHTGQYAGPDQPMELEVRTTVGERSWTITVERED
jgi:hypothetical protein